MNNDTLPISCLDEDKNEFFYNTKNIAKNLEGSLVSVYWEEGFNMWFDGVVEAVDPINGTISIYYPLSDESEKNTNLKDLIEHKWIKKRKSITKKIKNDLSNTRKKSENSPTHFEIDDVPLFDRFKESKNNYSAFPNTNIDSNPRDKDKSKYLKQKFKKIRISPSDKIKSNSSTKISKTNLSTNEKDLRFRNLICEDIKKHLERANHDLSRNSEIVRNNFPVSDMAKSLEHAIWAKCDCIVSENYKHKYRLFISSMNDPSNSEFRRSVCQGKVSPTQIMSLSETELMSNAKRAEIEALKIKINEARVIDIERAALMNTTAAEIYAEEIRGKTNKKIGKNVPSIKDIQKITVESPAKPFKDLKSITTSRNIKHITSRYDSTVPFNRNKTRDTTEWSGILSISNGSSENIYLLSVRIRLINQYCPIGSILPVQHATFKMSFWLDQFTSYLNNLLMGSDKRTFSLGVIDIRQNDDFSLIESKNLFHSYISSQLIGSADKFDHENRFDFHLLPSRLNLTHDLLEISKKINKDVPKEISSLIGPCDFLLVVVHPIKMK